MFTNQGVCEIKVPTGIGRLRNLQTLTGFTGLHACDGIARKFGSLTQLRRWGVMDVAKYKASESYIPLL